MNETTKTILILAVTLAAVICVAAAAFYVIVKIQTSARRRKIEGFGKESELRMDEKLRGAFGDAAVFTGIFLPYLNSREGKHAEIDHIVVTRAGVFVIEVKSHNGFIRCPDEKMWWQTYNDKKISFYNPLRQNHTHVRIVSEILKSEGQYNVPVYSVVVFTSRRVTFSHKYDNLVGGDAIIPYIKKTGKRNTLSTSQTGKVRAIIKNHAAKNKQVAKRHRSNMRGFDKYNKNRS